MREFGRVFCSIYESPDFRALSEDGRTLVLYLLTCKHATIAGVFRLPDGYACDDLQWSAERVSKGFENLALKGFATRCPATMWVWVAKFLEWNPPENPNQRKAACKVIERVPVQCTWRVRFLSVAGPSLGLQPPACEPPPPNPTETVQKPFPNKEKEKEQDKEKEQESSDADASGGAPPSPPALPEPPAPKPPAAPALKTASEEADAKLWRDLKTLFVEKDAAKDVKAAGVLLGALTAKYGADVFKASGRALLSVHPLPGEPHTYLIALCETAAGKRPGLNKQEQLEAQNLAAARAFSGAAA